MNVKKFVGDDVPKAMEQVKAELGVNAVILQTRRVRKKGLAGFFTRKSVEILAAYEDKKLYPPLRPPKEPAIDPRPRNDYKATQYANKAPLPKQPPPANGSYANAAHGNGSYANASYANASYANAAYGKTQRQQTKPNPFAQAPNPGGAVPREQDVGRAAAALDILLNNDQRDVRGGGLGEEYQRDRPKDQKSVNDKINDQRIDTIEKKISNIDMRLNQVLSRFEIERPSVLQADVTLIKNKLIENEVSADLAHRICLDVQEIVSKKNAPVSEVCEQVLMSYIGEPAPIALKKYSRSVILFIGPTGVGKTTTLAKLSAIYSINHSKKVSVITADTYRIAAVEQLKTYAEILDVPVDIIYSPDELEATLKKREDMDVVFIDTAGKSPNDKTHAEDVKALIKNSGANEIFLVMSATTGLGGCMNIINSYSYLDQYKLIFTKTDETPNIGVLLNVTDASKKHIAYITSGQNVPDDIEVLMPYKVINKLLGRDAND